MSNFIPIKIPKLSKITKREMDEIKRTDDRTRGSNSTQNETHIVCNERLAREGDKATCCGCLPHSGCLLGIKPFHGEYSTCPIDPDCKIEETMKYVRHKIPHERLPEVSKTKDRALQEDWKNSHDFKQAVYAADKLLDEPYADSDDDPRTVARQFNRMVERYNALSKERADARKEVITEVKEGLTKLALEYPELQTIMKSILYDGQATLREEEKPKEEKHGCCQCYCARCKEMCFRSRCVVHTEKETR